MCFFVLANLSKLRFKITIFSFVIVALLIWMDRTTSQGLSPDFVIKIAYNKPIATAIMMEESLHLSEQFGLKDLGLPVAENKKYYSAVYNNITPTENELNEIGKPYGIPLGVLYYQMMQESHGLPTKGKNHKGAKGYFQFQDATAKQTGLLTDAYDYRNNAYASADASSRYLLWNIIVLNGVKSSLLDGDNLSYALAAYNAGHKRLTMSGKTKLPPFFETITYVIAITALSRGDAVLVKRGDTLPALSKRTGFAQRVLLESNPSIQASVDLKAYQTLYLPDKDGHSQVVIKRGMSLFGLQKDTGIAVNDIKVANNMTGDIIRVADIVILPTSISAIGIERLASLDRANMEKSIVKSSKN
jgi:LysM repeat protein